MSEWMRDSRAACDRFAPTLALLDDPASSASSALDPAERAAALEHLAGCALCQADQAADARLDAALRRAFNPQVAAPLRTRDLLLAIGATHEPAPHATVTPARDAASPIRSVVNLGDFEDDIQGGSDRMSESDEAHKANGANAAATQITPEGQTGQREGQPAPARKMAAIPSLRPAPRPRGQRGRPGSQALAMGFSATAAAVILIVVAATLFASRGRARANTGGVHRASATATAGWQATASSFGPIYAIAMDAPTDGWALGDATPQSVNGGQPQTAAAFYHYDGAHWRLSQTVQGFGIQGRTYATLKMFSPTDGWAVDGSAGLVLHYDGLSWNAVQITPAGNVQIAEMLAVDMVSPTEGWAAALLSSAAPHSDLRFLRYDGSQWTVEPGSVSIPGVDANTIAIDGISAVKGGDVWAIGQAVPYLTAPTTSTSSTVGFIVHRVNGAWQLASQLNQPFAAESDVPVSILMTSATSGWIVGTRQSVKSSTNGEFAITHALVLHYDSSRTGSRWVPVNLPIANPTDGDQLNSITASGPSDVWIAGASGSSTITSSGLAISAMLFHYDGTKWTQEPVAISGVTGFNQVSVFVISEAPDGTLRGGGGLFKEQSDQSTPSPLIASYHNGVWSAAAIATK